MAWLAEMPYSINASNANCYPGTTILINKLDIVDQEALTEVERVSVSTHFSQIIANPPSDPFTFAFYRSLHRKLFGDLYEWAGELRNVDLSKKGTRFYAAASLAELGEAKFRYLQDAREFRGLAHEEFAYQIADFYHELNMLHPFREGNGRTQRLFFTLLIRRAGYNINFSDCDTDDLILATIRAAQGVMDYLIAFFAENITL